MSERAALPDDTAVHSRADLPPPRDRRKATRPVAPPLAHTPLRRVTYALAAAAALLVAFYAWRLVQWKRDVGGWTSLALGRRPPVPHHQNQNQNQNQNYGGHGTADANGAGGAHAHAPTVEDRIGELAAALGVPSTDLASAIAGAVRAHVPPASLSSVAAHETGDAAAYLVDPAAASEAQNQRRPGATASRGLKAVERAFEAVWPVTKRQPLHDNCPAFIRVAIASAAFESC